MSDKIIRTGSIAQDALRLGFQPTCHKGIERLLKIDDITTEECSVFKEKHLQNVQKFIDNIATKAQNEYHRESCIPEYYFNAYKLLHIIAKIRARKYATILAEQKQRIFTVKTINISEPILDLVEGSWKTIVNYTLEAEKWTGARRGKYVSEEKKIIKNVETVTTRAKVCTVSYKPYDEYYSKYIPDEAVLAAHEAKIIGLTDLCVATPKIEEATNRNLDPIIIGKVKEHMFIIAWFGYDVNNHMACNL